MVRVRQIDLRLCNHNTSNAYSLKLTNEMVRVRQIENNNLMGD